MKIIENRYIPLKRFLAINLFGCVFVKKGVKLSRQMLNHEYIHTMQQVEMCFVFFYLWYVMEWLVRLLLYRDAMRAYRSVLFEREAYRHQHDDDYRFHRKHFAWLRRGSACSCS